MSANNKEQIPDIENNITNNNILKTYFHRWLKQTTIKKNNTIVTICKMNELMDNTSDLSDTHSENSKEGNSDGSIIYGNDNNINKFKKLSYLEVETKVDKYYNSINHKYSSALDIIASYLKGQKIIYMEAKTFSETRLNYLMLPAIFLSSLATVLSSVLKEYEWGSTFISSINAFIAFLLAIVNYLKLDAASEAYKISSHQYDKLQSSVEFSSGSVLLFRDLKLYSGTSNNLDDKLKK